MRAFFAFHNHPVVWALQDIAHGFGPAAQAHLNDYLQRVLDRFGSAALVWCNRLSPIVNAPWFMGALPEEWIGAVQDGCKEQRRESMYARFSNAEVGCIFFKFGEGGVAFWHPLRGCEMPKPCKEVVAYTREAFGLYLLEEKERGG